MPYACCPFVDELSDATPHRAGGIGEISRAASPSRHVCASPDEQVGKPGTSMSVARPGPAIRCGYIRRSNASRGMSSPDRRSTATAALDRRAGGGRPASGGVWSLTGLDPTVARRSRRTPAGGERRLTSKKVFHLPRYSTSDSVTAGAHVGVADAMRQAGWWARDREISSLVRGAGSLKESTRATWTLCGTRGGTRGNAGAGNPRPWIWRRGAIKNEAAVSSVVAPTRGGVESPEL